MENSAFSLTNKIIEDVEAYILGFSCENRLQAWFSKMFVFPVKYLFLGAGELFKPFSTWAVMSFLFLFLGGFFGSRLNFSSEVSMFVLSLSIYAPMALVMFSVPSTYAFYGVKASHVEVVVQYIKRIGINDVETIELVEENMSKIQERITARISAYKWFVGSLWAFFTLMINQHFAISLKSSPENWSGVVFDNIVALSFFVAISLVAIAIIYSYKRASDLLMKTVGFGLVEAKYRVFVSGL